MANGIPSINEDSPLKFIPEMNPEVDLESFYSSIKSRENEPSMFGKLSGIEQLSQINKNDFNDIVIVTKRLAKNQHDSEDPEEFEPSPDEIAFVLDTIIQQRDTRIPMHQKDTLDTRNRSAQVYASTLSALEDQANKRVLPYNMLAMIEQGPEKGSDFYSHFGLLDKLERIEPLIFTYNEDQILVPKKEYELHVDELKEFYSTLLKLMGATIITKSSEISIKNNTNNAVEKEKARQHMENVRNSIVPLWQNKMIAARR